MQMVDCLEERHVSGTGLGKAGSHWSGGDDSYDDDDDNDSYVMILMAVEMMKLNMMTIKRMMIRIEIMVMTYGHNHQ